MIPAAFITAWRYLSLSTGRDLKEARRNADIAPNTAKSWLSILQASGIVYLLEPSGLN